MVVVGGREGGWGGFGFASESAADQMILKVIINLTPSDRTTL